MEYTELKKVLAADAPAVAAPQGLSPAQERELERMIDSTSLTHVLMSLTKVCQLKAQSDPETALVWEQSGAAINRASDETDQLGT
jgi:hypothetical protein